MNAFKEMADLVDMAKVEADKFYVNENMQAGSRYFQMLMEISRKCKEAREHLSAERKRIKQERKIMKEQFGS